LRTTKSYVVCCLSLRRTAKVFAGQKRRAPEQNLHGKGRAVRVLTFAVCHWHTAKAAFPVVLPGEICVKAKFIWTATSHFASI
jgi:hypothetical protein